MVERVALHRLAARLADQPLDVLDRQHLRRGGAGIMVDEFVADRAVDVISAVGERRLGRADAEHDPVGLDVVEVVEHEPADRHRPQAQRRRRLGEVGQPRVVGMEGERNESLEAAGLVLEFAEPQEVISAMEGVFDVAVEHGGVAPQAEFVGRAVDRKPLLRVGLVFADLVTNLGMKDFGAAAGEAAEARLFQFYEDVTDRPLRELGEPVDLDRRPGLEMQRGVGVVQDAEDVDIPVVALLVVQAAHDVHLG